MMPTLAVAAAAAAALADFELPAWCWWAEEEASTAAAAAAAVMAPFALLAELVADIAASLAVVEACCWPVAGSCSALDYLQALAESRLKSSWIAVAAVAAELACTVVDKAAAAADIPFESADRLVVGMARHS